MRCSASPSSWACRPRRNFSTPRRLSAVVGVFVFIKLWTHMDTAASRRGVEQHRGGYVTGVTAVGIRGNESCTHVCTTKFSPSQGRKFTCSTRAARAREFRRRVFMLITYICTHVRGGTGDEGEPIKERCLPRERSAALNYECLLFCAAVCG